MAVVFSSRAIAAPNTSGGGGGGTTFDYYISPTGSDSNLGTLASPWSLNALNTKTATYAGKKVGLMDGTYTLSSIYNGTGSYASYASWAADSGGYIGLFAIQGGSSANPTVIQAVNARMAQIIANNGTTRNIADPIFSDNSSSVKGNITIDGLYFQGAGAKTIYFGVYTGAQGTYSGYTVQNCEFNAQNVSGFASGGNWSSIETAGTNGLTIYNNYFHDFVGRTSATDADHLSTTLQWFARNVTISNNTIVNAPGVYGKEDGNEGTIIRYNYINCLGWKSGAIQDFNGNGATTLPSYFYNNVLLSYCPMDTQPSIGTVGWQVHVYIYNNTMLLDPAILENAGFDGYSNPTSRLITFYNNLVNQNGAGAAQYGNFYSNIGMPSLIDYNMYGASLWGSAPNNQTNSIGATSYSSLTNWRTAMAGATGGEQHSFVNASPLFTGTGTDAQKYQLQAGSPAKNTGSTTGLSSGSSCDIGAWGGASPPSIIGKNF